MKTPIIFFEPIEEQFPLLPNLRQLIEQVTLPEVEANIPPFNPRVISLSFYKSDPVEWLSSYPDYCKLPFTDQQITTMRLQSNGQRALAWVLGSLRPFLAEVQNEILSPLLLAKINTRIKDINMQHKAEGQPTMAEVVQHIYGIKCHPAMQPPAMRAWTSGSIAG